MDTTGTSKTHIGSDYISHSDRNKDTITVEPLANYSNCETAGKIIGYRDQAKIDAPVWKNSMCIKLGRLSQG